MIMVKVSLSFVLSSLNGLWNLKKKKAPPDWAKPLKFLIVVTV